MAFTEITAISAPTTGNAGETVHFRVSVRNVSAYPVLAKVHIILPDYTNFDIGGGELLNPGETKDYDTDWTMLPYDSNIFAYVWVLTEGDIWYTDTYKTFVIQATVAGWILAATLSFSVSYGAVPAQDWLLAASYDLAVAYGVVPVEGWLLAANYNLAVAYPAPPASPAPSVMPLIAVLGAVGAVVLLKKPENRARVVSAGKKAYATGKSAYQAAKPTVVSVSKKALEAGKSAYGKYKNK